jgi:hypothetical protein
VALAILGAPWTEFGRYSDRAKLLSWTRQPLQSVGLALTDSRSDFNNCDTEYAPDEAFHASLRSALPNSTILVISSKLRNVQGVDKVRPRLTHPRHGLSWEYYIGLGFQRRHSSRIRQAQRAIA